MESKDDIAMTAFFLHVDALADKIQQLVIDNTTQDADGYAIAVEAVTEVYQSLMRVPVYEELDGGEDA